MPRSRDAANAETRIQEARAIEAKAQEQLSFVRAKVAELEERLSSLTREFSKRAEELTPSPLKDPMLVPSPLSSQQTATGGIAPQVE